MSVIPFLVRRRNEVLKHLVSINAVGAENAKTFAEILEGFNFVLIKGLRERALKNDIGHLVRKKNVAIAVDGKYYLVR